MCVFGQTDRSFFSLSSFLYSLPCSFFHFFLVLLSFSFYRSFCLQLVCSLYSFPFLFSLLHSCTSRFLPSVLAQFFLSLPVPESAINILSISPFFIHICSFILLFCVSQHSFFRKRKLSFSFFLFPSFLTVLPPFLLPFYVFPFLPSLFPFFLAFFSYLSLLSSFPFTAFPSSLPSFSFP